MNYSPSGSSNHGIIQGRIMEWLAVPSSKVSSQPRDRTRVSPAWQANSLPLSHLASPYLMTAAAAAKSLQSCPTLCDPIDGSPPDFPVSGILQARALEWVAISFSNALYLNIYLLSAAASKSFQSCPTLCDPIDGSPPDSSVPGILQARTLEWVAISFSSA